MDDEVNVLNAIKRQFHRQFRIETASGGEQALEKIEKAGPFAVVVSDFKMQDMNGLTLRVRQNHLDTICVILTGFADLNLAVDAVTEAYFDSYQTLPA